jgi:hypothetical protein
MKRAILFTAMVLAAWLVAQLFPHQGADCSKYAQWDDWSGWMLCRAPIGSATVFASTLLSEVFLFAIWKVGDAFGLNAAPGLSMGFMRKYIPSVRTVVIALAIAGVAGGVFATIIRDSNARAKEQAEEQARVAAVAHERFEKAYQACARKYSTNSDAVANCTDWHTYAEEAEEHLSIDSLQSNP